MKGRPSADSVLWWFAFWRNMVQYCTTPKPPILAGCLLPRCAPNRIPEFGYGLLSRLQLHKARRFSCCKSFWCTSQRSPNKVHKVIQLGGVLVQKRSGGSRAQNSRQGLQGLTEGGFQGGFFRLYSTAHSAISKWPTIPQVYVNGEFLGGSDILISMHRSGELETLLKDVK